MHTYIVLNLFISSKYPQPERDYGNPILFFFQCRQQTNSNNNFTPKAFMPHCSPEQNFSYLL